MRLRQPTHRPGRRPLRLVRSVGAGGQPHPPDRFLDTRNAAGARNPKTGFVGPGTFALPVAGVGSGARRGPGGAGERHRGRPDRQRLRHGPPVRHRALGLELNFRVGQIVANLAVAGLDGSGQVCFTANVRDPPRGRRRGLAGRHGGLRVRAQTPERLMDTRTGQGGVVGPLPAGGVAQIAVPGATGCSARSPPSRRRARLPDGLPVPRPADGVEPQLRGGRHRAQPFASSPRGRVAAAASSRRRRPTSSSTARPPSSPDGARPPARRRLDVGRSRRPQSPDAVSRSCPCADGPRRAPPPARRRARPSPGGGRPCGGPGPGPARPWPARP